MKKLFALSVWVFFFHSFSSGQVLKMDQVVGDLSKNKFLWMVSGKLDSLENILDDRLKYIHSNGWTQTKKEVMQDLKNGKLVYKNISVDDMEVRVYESAAVVTGKGKFSGTMNSKPFEMDLLYTEVYILKMNQWLLVSRHANKLL